MLCFERGVLLNDCTSRVEVKGCFAAVFSVREVPALDVSAREPHLFSCASVSFFVVELCFVFYVPMFIVQCHTIPYDHPCSFSFAVHIVQLVFSRSHVLTTAVHVNTTHRFADTVRCRGGSHMVDCVASKGSTCFSQGGAVVLCAWCPRASFVSSVSVPCVFLRAAPGQS